MVLRIEPVASHVLGKHYNPSPGHQLFKNTLYLMTPISENVTPNSLCAAVSWHTWLTSKYFQNLPSRKLIFYSPWMLCPHRASLPASVQTPKRSRGSSALGALRWAKRMATLQIFNAPEGKHTCRQYFFWPGPRPTRALQDSSGWVTVKSGEMSQRWCLSPAAQKRWQP